MSTPQVAILASVLASVIGLQTYWIAHAINALTSRVDRFDDRMHDDLHGHTEAIAGLRDRVARLERDA